MILDVERKERAEAHEYEEGADLPRDTLATWLKAVHSTPSCLKWTPDAEEHSRRMRVAQPFGARPSMEWAIQSLASRLSALLTNQGIGARSWTSSSNIEMAQDLLESLAIDESQAAGMLRTTPDAIREYLAGRRAMPSSVETRIREAHAALRRLLRIFRRDRLGEVLRRQAPAFGKQPALDLILNGRIVEVVDVYERALTYQG
jgi:hypothetical protein